MSVDNELNEARQRKWENLPLTERQIGLLQGYSDGYQNGLDCEFSPSPPDVNNKELWDGYWAGYQVGLDES